MSETNTTLPQQRKRRANPHPADAPIRALYDGGTDRIGTIVRDDQKYLAFNRLGRPLGIYASAEDAARAIGNAEGRGGTS